MFLKKHEILPKNVGEGVTRKVLVYSDAIMMVEVSFGAGAVGDPHKHPHQQASYVLEGTFEVTVNGETRTMTKGDSFLAPPDAIHGVKALVAGKLLDVFTPKRDDFLQ